MIGFTRVLGNLGVFLFWIVLAANFMSHEAWIWVDDDTSQGNRRCIAGVAVGANLWFFVVSYMSSRGQGRLSEQTLLRMEHFSGICLLVLGFYHGGHIAWQLARHRHGI